MITASLFNDLKRVLRALATDRRRFVYAVFLCAAGGIVELVGVGTLYPFLSLLAKPEIVETNRLLQSIYQYGQFRHIEQFMLWSGWIALIIFFLSSIFLFAKNAYITRFCVGQAARVSVRVLDSYLRKPMTFHVGHNSGALCKDVISNADLFTYGVLVSVMSILGDGAILIVLIGFVLWLDPKVGLTVTVMLGLILSCALVLTRDKVLELGRRNDEANVARFSFCLTALQSVKEIKTTGKESFFAGLFRMHATDQAQCYEKLTVMQMLPAAITQFIAAAAIICMALYYIATGADISTIVPTLIMYAVAGYRLLPSVGKIAGAMSQLRQYQPIISNVDRTLSESAGAAPALPKSIALHPPAGTAIELRSVDFTFPGQSSPFIENLNLRIEGNSLVCFAGRSGSGKTTLADLMLGLLPATRGRVTVDGISIADVGESRWHSIFGYVPQSVYIVDGTIASNIAFGVRPEDVDRDWLQRVVAMCHLEDFVDAQTRGLDAQVGDRGSRLSGGQRQRLGIARALYRNPPILILDESTSSLDGISERAIIQTLLELRKTKIIISIAHRGALLRHCDRILLVDSGRVVGDGDYSTLDRSSDLFRSLMSELEVRKS